MKTEKISERFVKSLLLVMPSWHSRLVRPFKESLNREMTLETYYCLETLRACKMMTMTELARQLKIPKQQVTKLIDKLSEHNYIERIHSTEDRRSVWIHLTPDAIEYLDNYYKKNQTFIRSLEEQLTSEELQRLNEAVEVLAEILPKLN